MKKKSKLSMFLIILIVIISSNMINSFAVRDVDIILDRESAKITVDLSKVYCDNFYKYQKIEKLHIIGESIDPLVPIVGSAIKITCNIMYYLTPSHGHI